MRLHNLPRVDPEFDLLSLIRLRLPKFDMKFDIALLFSASSRLARRIDRISRGDAAEKTPQRSLGSIAARWVSEIVQDCIDRDVVREFAPAARKLAADNRGQRIERFLEQRERCRRRPDQDIGMDPIQAPGDIYEGRLTDRRT
jgi:hypothetical protein